MSGIWFFQTALSQWLSMVMVLRQDHSGKKWASSNGQLCLGLYHSTGLLQPNSPSFSLSFIRCQTQIIVRMLSLPFSAFFPNTLPARCISHLLHNKLFPNLLSYNNTHLLSHSYCGSRIWVWLSQVLCFRISHMTAIRCQPVLESYLKFDYRKVCGI